MANTEAQCRYLQVLDYLATQLEPTAAIYIQQEDLFWNIINRCSDGFKPKPRGQRKLSIWCLMNSKQGNLRRDIDLYAVTYVETAE